MWGQAGATDGGAARQPCWKGADAAVAGNSEDEGAESLIVPDARVRPAVWLA